MSYDSIQLPPVKSCAFKTTKSHNGSSEIDIGCCQMIIDFDEFNSLIDR